MKKFALLFVLAVVSGAPAWAADKTVGLTVPGMTCAACPITVRTALSRVAGVEKVDVDYPRRLVLVRYDDAKTGPTALEQATRDAGYPSQPAKVH